jgi:hypothetical protein
MTLRQVQHSLVAFGGNLQLNDESLIDSVRAGVMAIESPDVQLVKISRSSGLWA